MKGMSIVKKNKVGNEQAKYNRGQIVVKIVAAILALMMVVAVGASAIYALFV